MACKVKTVSFIKNAFLANRFSKGPKEVIATKGTLCLVEAVILNSRDQITEVESAEEQLDVRRSTRSRKEERKMLLIAFL